MVTIYNLKSNFQVILLFEADSPLKERKGKAVFFLFNYVQWVLY